VVIRKIILLVLLFLLVQSESYSQVFNSPRDTIVVPGKEYKAGWFHKFIFGKHWRDVWTTPIKVKILDLNNFAGGLTPTRKGGGLQTRTLHLLGKDGLDYKFRSIDKDPARMLPDDLKETFV